MTAPIQISSGPFSALILPVGATLSRFQIGERDLVLGFYNPADHRNVPIYAGAIVGPIANRIANGQFHLNGLTYQMPCNENGETTLHSGPDGMHAQTWRILSQCQSSVTLGVTLRHAACGLPGLREITVQYRLDASGLTLVITARTDTPTPMNIAHHPYWSLDADLAQTRLQIMAAQYLPQNLQNLPTGQICAVHNSAFDFTSPRMIGDNLNLDHNYCLSHVRRDSPQHDATLIAADGLRLHIETTEPGLQVYAGAGLPRLAPSRSFGHPIAPHAGIALEPQGWPNAPNHAHFPSTILTADKIYKQITRYRIS